MYFKIPFCSQFQDFSTHMHQSPSKLVSESELDCWCCIGVDDSLPAAAASVGISSYEDQTLFRPEYNIL